MVPPVDLSFLQSRSAWKRIGAVVVGATVLGAVYALLAPTWYRSAVTVVPSTPPKSPSMAGLLGGDLGGLAASLGGAPDVARIAAVLQSVAVSDSAVEKFDLKTRYDVRYQESARDELWEHCEVKALPKPGVVHLSCEDREPRFTRDLLAHLTDHGNQVFRRVSFSAAAEEAKFLEQRVAELRTQADETASRMREFQEKHQIVDLDSQARALVSSVATLNSQRIAKRLELEWARTYSSRDEATAQRLESQISVVDEALRDLEASEPPPTATARVGKAQPATRKPGMFPAALEVPQLRAEYEKLFRNRKVAETTLILALDRLEGARAAAARDVSTFQVLDPPTVPTRKARPQRLKIVLNMAALGLVAGVLLEWRRSRRTRP